MTKIEENKNHILQLGSKNLDASNWKVFHPNGRHMFTCGGKKAKWYLDRNLADKIGDNKIKLNFTPKGNGYADNEKFGLFERKNICVVSGVCDNLQRHHIVPYCYRTHFPDEFKSKNHHDVVLINSEKHAEYEKEATKFKDEIAKIFNVKTIAEFNAEYTIALKENNKYYGVVVNAIKPIFNSYSKISVDSVIEKLKYVSGHTEIPIHHLKNLNYIQLYKFYSEVKTLYDNKLEELRKELKHEYDHGYHVVKQLNTDNKIKEFVVMWRKHFIETAKPKFMPEGWSFDFRVKTRI
jgi:hypothetical protein